MCGLNALAYIHRPLTSLRTPTDTARVAVYRGRMKPEEVAGLASAPGAISWTGVTQSSAMPEMALAA